MKINTFFKVMAIALIAAFAANSAALAEEKAPSTVESVLSEVRQAQNVSSVRDVKCQAVTDGQFEKLGDAVMNVMHPDDNEHELMDQMMGGEGSSSLKAMHIAMGRRYLGCWTSGNYDGYYGMMGQGYGMMGMMGIGNYYGGMMGNWGYGGWLGWFAMAFFWIAAILGFVAVVKWMIGKQSANGSGKNALEILKDRYAKGEIGKDEFEAKRKDLQ